MCVYNVSILEGTNILMFPDEYDNPGQSWVRSGNKVVSKYNVMRTLDIKKKNKKKGTDIVITDYKGQKNQHWYFVSAGSHEKLLHSVTCLPCLPSVQRQTAVTAYLSSKQLLMFAFGLWYSANFMCDAVPNQKKHTRKSK